MIALLRYRLRLYRLHRLTKRLGPPILAAAIAFAVVLPVACSSKPSGPSKEETVYVSGQTYFGENDYIEYMAGDLPIVLGAPHGGYLTPTGIPDRTWGVTGRDSRTQETARAFSDALYQRTGRRAHIVINRLARIKLDANREIVEAAQGSAEAEQAWRDWHTFIEVAKDTITARYGAGLYIDLHGHGHEIQRLELGYLLNSAELALSDQEMIDLNMASESSIKALSLSAAAGFPELLRGMTSLGALLQIRGYDAVPSPWAPNPAGAPYFSGGYNTRRHGSRDGGTISSIQIECNWQGVRDSESNRAAFAVALASALQNFFETHFGITLAAP